MFIDYWKMQKNIFIQFLSINFSPNGLNTYWAPNINRGKIDILLIPQQKDQTSIKPSQKSRVYSSTLPLREPTVPIL